MWKNSTVLIALDKKTVHENFWPLKKEEIGAATYKVQERINQMNLLLNEKDEEQILFDCKDPNNPVNLMDLIMGYDFWKS